MTVLSHYTPVPLPQQRHNNSTSNHRLAERVKTVCPSLLLSLTTSLAIPSHEEEWSACAVVSLFRDDAQRNAERWIHWDGRRVRRRMSSSWHRKRLSFIHHGSDFFMTSSVDYSFVLVILVSSSSSSFLFSPWWSSPLDRDGSRAYRQQTSDYS
jgi:hypothetical protein